MKIESSMTSRIRSRQNHPMLRHLVGSSILMICGLTNNVIAQTLATFEILPSSTIKVNQEVFLDGSKSVYGTGKTPTTMLWNYGDGISSNPSYGGITVSHFYTRPGIFTITLSVTYSDGVSESVSKSVAVQGIQPKLAPRAPRKDTALEVKLDGNLMDSSPSNASVEWLQQGQFVAGKEGTCVDLSGEKYIKVNSHPSLEYFISGFTLSFWARRSGTDINGCLVHQPGLVYAYTTKSGSSTIFSCTLYSTSGSVTVKNFFAPADLDWHHYAIIYDNSTVTLYIDGQARVETGKNPMAFTGILGTTASDLFIGNKQDGTLPWNGLVDEVKIFDRCLTENELFQGFDSEHANFHCRLRQYITYKIPSDITDNAENRLKVTLSRTGLNLLICDRNNLKDTEQVLLRQETLAQGDYTLTAQLMDRNDAILDEYIEYFSKPYDGIPKVGLDENNAICINGNLFYPVTPWGLNASEIAVWTRQPDARINCLFSQGCWPINVTSAGWEIYLNAGNKYSIPAIGPVGWQGKLFNNVRNTTRFANIEMLKQYVNLTKNHPGMLAWMWDDEPDLGGHTQITPAEVLRSWTYVSHQLDPQHPVTVNMVGKNWADESKGFNRARRGLFCYTKNGTLFGKKTYVTDIMGFDYYPLDWRYHADTSITKLALGLDQIQKENPHVPVMSFIETADIRDDALAKYGNRAYYPDMTPTPTAAQIKMLAWLHVVHGIKGVNWFHFFEDKNVPENFAAMSEFCRQITELSPVVLSRQITSNSKVEPAQGRVDWMVKEDADALYLFAVRLTEVDETVTDPHTQITIPEIDSFTATVLYENRKIQATNHSFTDDFNANGVHIYKIDKHSRSFDARENELSLIELTPTDPSGNPVTYSPTVTGLPKRASFDPDTHVLAWRPWYDQAGTYDLSFSAINVEYVQKVTIEVADVFLKTWYHDWINSTPVQSAMVEY